MNTRGRRLVNLVKKSDQSSEITSPDNNDNRLESPVPYNECTEEEWNFLEDIYDNAFPAKRTESGDGTTSDCSVNDSHNVILGSEESTTMPSPSVHDFHTETPLIEDPVHKINKEDNIMPMAASLPNQDSPLNITRDLENVPSVNSLISLPASLRNQDFHIDSPPNITRDLENVPSVNSLISFPGSLPNQDFHIDSPPNITRDLENVPSVNSLISLPGSLPNQDFHIDSPPNITRDLEDVPSVNSLNSLPASLPNQDFHIDSPPNITQDLENVPSVNSLISIPEIENPVTPDTSITRKRKATYKSDPGRKRKRHVNQWADNRRKLLTNSGNQYVSKRGKTVPAKNMKQACPATCKLKCSEYFTEDIRKNIFDEFWQLADHTKQWMYINKFTKRHQKKRMTTEGPSRRKFTTKYYLPLPTNDTYEIRQICLKMFCGTLSITDQTIRTAHEKLDPCGITGNDNRGKHQNHAKKIDEEMIRSVCDHVKSYQPVESHYTRKSSSKLYLDNSLSFNKMFLMYKDWPELNSYNNTAETERQYRNIVNDHMNIAFFTPKKDLCNKCHAFTNLETPTADQISTHDTHISNKENARIYKAQDKEDATNNTPTVVCATYDFQKVLNCPSGEVSLFYYKRKLSLINFTVFDCSIKEAYCYLWPENVVKRGANEVGSCLLNFIEKKKSSGATDIRFWSDNCSGQNRNRVIYSLYMYASIKYNVDITHRFLESGHTQQEADSVHALIERSVKGKIIYTPDQWYALVRWAKTNDKPYNVIEVSQDSLYNLKQLLQNRNFKKNTLNQDVKWNNIKEVCVKKSEPNVIFYKYDFESDYLTLNTLILTRRNRKTIITNQNRELNILYSDNLPIPQAKYKDLMSLCEAGHIPKQYHNFFKNLKTTQNESSVIVSESDDDD